MAAEPVQVARQEWWCGYYAGGRPVGLEWYAPNEVMEPFLKAAVASVGTDEAPAALHVGCGVSTLHEDLLRIGCGRVANIDYSPEVVAQMTEDNSDARASFHVADARRTGFADGEFALVADKGTLDCLVLAGRAEASAYLAEARRVTVAGGRMVVCSVHAGRFADGLLPDRTWRLVREEAVEFSPLELPHQKFTYMYELVAL